MNEIMGSIPRDMKTDSSQWLGILARGQRALCGVLFIVLDAVTGHLKEVTSGRKNVLPLSVQREQSIHRGRAMNCFLVMGARRARLTLGILNRIEDRREEKWMAAFKYLTQRHQARPHLKVSQPPKAESPPWEQVFKYGLRGPFHIQEVRPRVYLTNNIQPWSLSCPPCSMERPGNKVSSWTHGSQPGRPSKTVFKHKR